MDWRRAKTILIIAFLLLDSFLVYQLWSSKGKNLEVVQQAVGSSSSFQDILKARNIKLSTEAPAETPEMYYLNIKYEDYAEHNLGNLANQNVQVNGNTLQSEFVHPLAEPSNQTKTDFAKGLSTFVSYADEYVADPVLSNTNRLVYLQRWDNYPFFGASLVFNDENHKLTGYSQIHFQVVNKGSGKKVISSLAAARTLIENGAIRNGETIHAIELGYYGHTYDAEIQVMAPVWRVVHDNGQIHYVNGITGVIEKTASIPKKE